MIKEQNNRWWAVLPALLMPVLLGLACYFVLVGAIERRLIDDDLLTRYITGHPVSKVTTAMFLVGISSLLLIGSDILDQFSSIRRVTLREPRKKKRCRSQNEKQAEPGTDSITAQTQTLQPTSGPGTTADSVNAKLIEKLEKFEARLLALPRRLQKSYLWTRLSNALGFVRQNSSAVGLDDELRYLSEADLDKKHERYSLVRILIWATPMLGFLGTVLGISEALGGIAGGPGNDFQQMMSNLQGSLYIAFDTTALALTFSIVLMFCQFLADRFESQLLTCVDQSARTQLEQRFELESDRQDEYVKAIRKLGQEILTTNDKLVKQQCELWNKSIVAAQDAWVESAEGSRNSSLKQLQTALDRSTGKLAEQVGRTIEKADKTLERRIKQWQMSLSQLAQNITEQQKQLERQTMSVNESIQQFKQIEDLQQNLNNFLSSVPESSLLSETADKLSTAIRLLEFRLSDIELEPNTVQLPTAQKAPEMKPGADQVDDSEIPNDDRQKRRAA